MGKGFVIRTLRTERYPEWVVGHVDYKFEGLGPHRLVAIAHVGVEGVEYTHYTFEPCDGVH